MKVKKTTILIQKLILFLEKFSTEPNLRKFKYVSITEWIKHKPEEVECSEWNLLWLRLKTPERATEDSSGYDFFAPFSFTLAPSESIIIPTGIKAYMNKDNELLIFPRSSLGFKFEMKIANTLAKIDSDYVDNEKNEGHILIKITNGDEKEMGIEQGDAFCQGTFYKYLVTMDDTVQRKRVGGIGSTNEAKL